jgi:hypothetical protein
MLMCGVQFPIIEFDPETFRILLDYLHTGSCPLTCSNIPGLICAAEHYDLPELLQACFHHAKQFLRIEVVSPISTWLLAHFYLSVKSSQVISHVSMELKSRVLETVSTHALEKTSLHSVAVKA